MYSSTSDCGTSLLLFCCSLLTVSVLSHCFKLFCAAVPQWVKCCVHCFPFPVAILCSLSASLTFPYTQCLRCCGVGPWKRKPIQITILPSTWVHFVVVFVVRVVVWYKITIYEMPLSVHKLLLWRQLRRICVCFVVFRLRPEIVLKFMRFSFVFYFCLSDRRTRVQPTWSIWIQNELN